jgi:hypothetical protein
MTDTIRTNNKEERAVKKILVMAAIAVTLIALTAVPAFAEGYNDSGDYTRANGYFSGPHGGYTTTTNKCAVCHSTHYAEGSFMLLRANSREAACDYCHGGGGGSTINIQMDNEYKDMSDPTTQTAGIAEINGGSGLGTGHTLGYTGLAPVDIKPAYQASGGFACFDCHSPHGNSARIIGVMANPGRSLGTDNVVIPSNQPPYIGNSADGIVNSAGEWGIDPIFGNFKWFGDPWAASPAGRPADDTAGGRLIYRPIFPAGRFMLLKDPHSTAQEGKPDTATPISELGDVTALATGGLNKFAINWDEPMGPADGGYGGGQDNDNDSGYLFAPQYVDGDGNTQGGFGSLSEFCTDCHDGTAGASTQAAEVYFPSEGGYVVAYSHDAQPRH